MRYMVQYIAWYNGAVVENIFKVFVPKSRNELIVPLKEKRR